MPIDGWSVQYASAAGGSWQVTPITGTLQPGQTYVLSVGMNSVYAKTTNGLAQPIVDAMAKVISDEGGATSLGCFASPSAVAASPTVGPVPVTLPLGATATSFRETT